MGALWVFVDEFGDRDYTGRSSRYFGLAAVTTPEPRALVDAVESPREEFWSEHHLQRGYFHAHMDCWEVRNRVFEMLRALPIRRLDTIALKKARVHRSLRSPPSLYRTAATLLFGASDLHFFKADSLTVVAADWRPRVSDVRPMIRELLTGANPPRPVLWNEPLSVLQAPAAAHGGLQVADYLGWASNRLWTSGEPRYSDVLRNATWETSFTRASSL